MMKGQSDRRRRRAGGLAVGLWCAVTSAEMLRFAATTASSPFICSTTFSLLSECPYNASHPIPEARAHARRVSGDGRREPDAVHQRESAPYLPSTAILIIPTQ